jgi:hypothetical protein
MRPGVVVAAVVVLCNCAVVGFAIMHAVLR